MIINQSILSDVMKDSQLSDIANIFYVEKNKGKYQKQYLVNKGDLIETDTEFIEYELDEHKVIVNYSTDDNIVISDDIYNDCTVELNQVVINAVHNTIHNHVLNYITSNAKETFDVKYYKPDNIVLRFIDNIINIFKPRSTDVDVINLITSKCNSDSVVILSVSAYREIMLPINGAIGKLKIMDAFNKVGFNSNYIHVGYIEGNTKYYVTPSSTEKSILIINKNDLDVIINRGIKILHTKGLNRKSVDIPVGIQIKQNKPCITKINLI